MNSTRCAFAVLVIPLIAGCQAQKQVPATMPSPRMYIGTIERHDPAVNALLPADARIEVLAQGFTWTEGPLWLADQRKLIFSDVPRNTIFQWQEGRGTTVFMQPSGYTGAVPRGGEPGSNGLTLDPQGRLTLCQHGDRRVARVEDDGKTLTPLADQFEGRKFNSPNDLCFDSRGNLFFTDPPYGLEKNMDDPKKEMPFQGVYRRSAEGKLTVLTRDLTRPNGIALSPDEKTLYVAVSDDKSPRIWAFDLKSDGTAGAGRVFFDASALVAMQLKGMPDGLKVDQKGNLWATGPGGVLILSPEGKHLGTLNTGQPTANCAWGDDGATLYITANMYICRVRTLTRGAVPGRP